ncbi:Alpha/Beta hydrolase protein [Ilyonectria destructans]|nr:Alpha/Beta hydrolase protein [Ilyonectria destructans]
MAFNPPGKCCTLGFRHEGELTGKPIKIGDGKMNAYLALPPAGTNAKIAAVLYLTDLWVLKGRDGDNPHIPETVDPAIIAGIKALRDLGIANIGAVGYCFGAKYVVRHYSSGFKLQAISGPLSIAAAEIDTIVTTEMRHESEKFLSKTGQPWQINLFSGVEHGFATRGDLTVRRERFAKEQAFLQAVAWFDKHLLQETHETRSYQ